MVTQLIENPQLRNSKSYQLIKDETLSSMVVASQVLAGSCISSCLYKQVVFSDCIFYACNFLSVTFENCVFENCMFEFSHLKDCKFNNCNFSECKWVASSSKQSAYINCELDFQLHEMIIVNTSNEIDRPIDDNYTLNIPMSLLIAA
jgi:uncharacterized protein YjbI with pentapeptide repeats